MMWLFQERPMKKILLADDHAPTRMMFSKILAEQRYCIIQASNGEEAYTKAVAEQPDLILLDIVMPVMDGYEALLQIKADPVTQPIQVIMLTALDRPFEQKLALEMGASGYIVKPVRIDELYRNIKYALAKVPPKGPQLYNCTLSSDFNPVPSPI
jgi:CheY-like chemotaxis protein